MQLTDSIGLNALLVPPMTSCASTFGFRSHLRCHTRLWRSVIVVSAHTSN